MILLFSGLSCAWICDRQNGPNKENNCFVDTFNTGPIYLQGTKSGPNFVDDDGQVITYFNWDSGEPGNGNYLRTDTNTRLQETSYGTNTYKSICRLY